MNVLTLEEIVERLKQRNIAQVSRDSGVSAPALYKIKDGLRTKIGLDTAIKLTKVLDK